MADIGSLIVRIRADSKELERTFSDLSGSASQFNRAMDNIRKTVATTFFGVATAAFAMTVQAAKTAEATEHLHQKTGIASASLEGMSVSLNRNNLGGEHMATAMKGLARQMVGVIDNTASSVKLFNDLGVSLDVVGKGTGATLSAIADRFSQIPAGAMKAQIAVDLFGKAGLDLIPMLNQGGAALDESMRKSAEFGLVLTDVSRTDLAALADAMDDMQSALRGFAMQVGVAFSPAVIILVHALTSGIVFAKDAFNTLSDASAVLVINFATLVANIQLLTARIFSMKVFSKAAWEETINHMRAINDWGRAQIAGVKTAREAEKGLGNLAFSQENAASATEKHSISQQALGENIVSATKIQLAQIKALGEAQMRMGDNIVSSTTIQLKQLDAQSKKIFQEIFDAEEAMSSASYALGPDPSDETGRQRILRENLLITQAEFDIQRAFYAEAPGLIDQASNARKAGLAVIEAEGDLEEYNIRRLEESEASKTTRLVALDAEGIAKRIAIAKQFPDFWERQLQGLVDSNAFSISQITSAWTSGLANSIVNGGDFIKAAWQSTQLAVVQGGLNMALQWSAQQGMMLLASSSAATGTAGVWAGAGLIVQGVFASVTAAFATMFATLVTTITAVATYVMGVLSAIANALAATVFGIPFAGAILVGIVGILAALAATGNLGFKDGGIGDFGSGTTATLHGPEAIIPLNARGAAFMNKALGGGVTEGGGRVIHTHVHLNGREIAKAVNDEQPGAWRSMGLAT